MRTTELQRNLRASPEHRIRKLSVYRLTIILVYIYISLFRAPGASVNLIFVLIVNVGRLSQHLVPNRNRSSALELRQMAAVDAVEFQRLVTHAAN